MQSFFTKLWKRRPLFFAGLFVVVALIGGDLWPGFGRLWCVLLASLGVLALGWKAGLFLAVCVGVSVSNLHFREVQAERDATHLTSLTVIEAEGRLLEDAIGTDGKWVGIVRLSSPSLPEAKVRWRGSGPLPMAGTELRATGVFHPLEEVRNPGLPDRSARLRSLGVVAHFHASEMRTERWVGPISKFASGIRNGFYRAITRGLDPGSEAFHVIRAVVLGERSDEVPDLGRKFRESGTLHVFTVSGMHVVMVGGIGWMLLSFLRVKRRFAIPLIILTMFGYSWMTGSGPAAVRAAWMGTVFLCAFLVKRRPDLLNAMGAVLLFNLLWDPRIVRMPGVQLSYGVVAAIGLLTVHMRGLFNWIAAKELLLPTSEYSGLRYRWLQFRQKLADALSVSTAASIGSLPLTYLYFGIITPVSILATVALVPQVYLLLSAAIVSAVVSPFSITLNKGINLVNARVAQLCAGTAGGFSKIPGAWAAPGIRGAEKLIIYDLEFGNAAAVFVSAEGNAVLIDSGGDFALNSEIMPSLQRLGIHPDAIIFTHEDSGHVASPEKVRSIFHITQVALPEPRSKSSTLGQWREEKGIRIAYLEHGVRLDLGGGCKMEVLYAPEGQTEMGKADDRCVVMRMEWNGFSILWQSDAGEPVENILLKSGLDLRADMVVSGSYENGNSLSDEFIAAVRPSMIIIPRSPTGGISDRQAVQRERWQAKGIKIVDQLAHGGITLEAHSKGEMIVEGFLDKSRFKMKSAKEPGDPR